MDKLFFILSVIILLFSFFYVLKKKRALDEQQNLTLEELWEKEKTKFEERRKELEKSYSDTEERARTALTNFIKEKEQQEEKYRKELYDLQRQIDEKNSFNSSLLKIREDELNRLIEEKRKEKEAFLVHQIEQLTNQKTSQLNTEFLQFQAEQQKVKEKVLQDIEQYKQEVEEFRLRRESINQAILREKELQEKEDFYRIVVSENDKEDMAVLMTIAPKLKNRESLNKLIYDVFIKRPLSEMIKRVTGGRAVSGIYKITYIKTGESYIGKTTDIQTRWQNHIKTACGLEGAAHSTFHTRLEKDGLWNYTFEILEEVPKDKLTEREKFYIELYGTDKQLNMKKG